MKIRSGFVSNSSSSSFVVYGVRVESDDVETACKKLKIKWDEDNDGFDSYEALEKLSDKLGVKHMDDSEGSGEYYFGVAPGAFAEDKTMRANKKEIEKKLKKSFPEAECDWIEEVIIG